MKFFIKNPKTILHHTDKDIFIYLYRNFQFNWFKLNKTGYEIWELCDGKNSIEQISLLLGSKYGLPHKKIENIVKKFLVKLLKEHLINYTNDESNEKKIETNYNLIKTNSFQEPEIIKFPPAPKVTAITKPHAPLDIIYEVTSFCNLHCRHCYVWDSMKKTKDLSTNEVKQVIDKISNNHAAAKITFLGGEPFTRKDMFEIIKYAKERGIITEIVTNASLLDKEKIIRLKRIGVDRLTLTLYDVSPQIHDYITACPGLYKRTVQSLKVAIEQDLEVQINFPLTKINFYKVFKVYNLLKSLSKKSGKLQLSIIVFIRWGGGRRHKKEFVPTTFQYLLLFGLIEPFLGKLGKIPVHIANCNVGKVPVIKPNGDLCPCLSVNMPIGNVLKDSLEDLWKDERLQYFATRWEVEPCSYCFLKKFCHGPCKFSYEEGDITCPLGKVLKNLKSMRERFKLGFMEKIKMNKRKGTKTISRRNFTIT